MGFLTPLFLLGALTVALPLIFHLIRRTSKEQIPFSSLMFLQATLPRMTKRNRLEHIFLLLLRCLVICLLALGFARPFMQKLLTTTLPADTGQKVILLVDTSASMRREGMWTAALAKATEVLSKTSPGDQVAVFTFDRQAHSLVSFDQWSAMSLNERQGLTASRLAAVKPGWASTHLGNALLTAAAAFAETDKQGKNPGLRRLILISDLQEGSQLDGLQGFDWPRGMEVRVEPIIAKRPTNAGLHWITDTGNAATPEVDAGPRLRVSNSTQAKREQFQIRWEGVAGAMPLDVYVPPGQNRVVPAPKLPPGAAGERLVLTGDDDDFDNVVHLVQFKAEPVNVLYLGGETETNSTQPLYYLKRAFQQTTRQIVQINAHALSEAFLPAELAGARLLIATDRLPENQEDAVRSFLASGGTTLFLLNNKAAAESLGRLSGINDLTAKEVTPANYAMFGVIDFEHPLFAPFANPRYSDFTKIHFWKYRQLDTGRLPGARVLAKFDNGDPVLVEIPRDKGRLLVLTSGWQPADSQLALSSKFVPLLYAILELSGGIKAPVTQVLVGDPVDLRNLMTPKSGQTVTVVKPDGSQVPMGGSETNFIQTDLPGIYTVSSAQPPVRFAVNLDALESRTAPMPIEQLERLGVPLKPVQIELTRQLDLKRLLHDAELENQQKLWRWLTVAALVLLLLETGLAGWITRRTAF